MRTLKFRDKRAEVKTANFKELPIGGTFEYDERLFIKINDDHAFDVCNLILEWFKPMDNIIEREAEIIFS